MQKIRQFRDLLFQLKATEATGAWKALGRFGRWLLGVPGAIRGALIALFRFIARVGGATPGFLWGLLLKAPAAIFAVLAFIGMVIIAILLFVWWYVIPGVAAFGVVVGIISVLFHLTFAWWLKILAVLGILAAFVAYWNILAAAMGTWGDEPTNDLMECLGRAISRIWGSYIVEAILLLTVFLLVKYPEVFVFIAAAIAAIMCLAFLVFALSED